MKLVTVILFFALAFTAAAQTTNTFDSSGNSLLNGTYYFRDVTWVVGDNSGNLARGIVLTGTMNFDGNGNYVLSCRVLAASDGSFACPSGTIAGQPRSSGTFTFRVAVRDSSSPPVQGVGTVKVIVAPNRNRGSESSGSQ